MAFINHAPIELTRARGEATSWPVNKPAILVTGAAKRLGAAIANSFGQAGWHVVIHYRSSAEQAQVLADALPSAETVQCDLADCASAAEMIEDLAARLTDWRVVVNSASIFEPDNVTGIDGTTYERAMKVNAQAPALMAQKFFCMARAQGGRRVIQLTDQKIANTNPDFFSYTMSKHAVHGAVGMLAKAHVDPRDRVYSLAPGAVLPSHDQDEAETDASHVLNLLRRKTGAEEVGKAALFLAEGYLKSGATLFVDSGQHLLDQPRDVIYLARENARK